ncbi:Asp23/Gls24 family envelope stress response protein [Umezawaea sp. Da 62-37]|uniref:Asp23/Gls24 family envelope stress response protein n=1 Tax=Umezawaea sp. Da 62-37 TaxID=3075927 RepID=UPI0028F7225C|nr:Asp23/Gls24 family envelope stress response protein [Umezawaea sp. Da 62-37]WNV88442.1 Asp23/Gls24 family envelope stress response protein [Umezawaea sp. Da 62-37]
MAMNETDQGYLLPCGRDVEAVWDRLDEIDAHELECPHCLGARESLRALRAVTEEMARDTSEPSRALFGRIMSAVRAEVRRGDMLPLAAGDLGPLSVSERAIAAVLRFAVDGVAGVRARHCQVTAKVDVVNVELRIAVSVDFYVPDVVELVRERVTTAATARVGMRVNRLDVTVEDLYDL